LQEEHEVKTIEIKNNSTAILKNLINLWLGVIWCDMTFSWFGKLHAFFAVLFSKILGKKSVVVAGGDDVVCEPEIKYGMFCFWWKKWCPFFVFKFADVVLTVSDSNTAETINNAGISQKKIKRIYHGFDENVFKRKEGIKKENIVITVGSINQECIKRKGLELFVKAAKELQDVKFYLIGECQDNAVEYLRSISSSNLLVAGKVSDKDLLEYMSRAKVYVQVSFHEGFGCSLAEAMLCECIPVVSRNAAIPEVVGEVGVYVDTLTPEEVAEKIKYALNLSDGFGNMARDRIIENFFLKKRKKEILEAIK